MENLSEIEKELIKLGGSNATNKTETVSKASDKGGQHISTTLSDKNGVSVKSGDISVIRQGDSHNPNHGSHNSAKYFNILSFL